MMNILLVEDQDDSRKTLSRLIGMRGHKVTQVATAEEAERAMATETFPFLILDWMLPGKSGIDLCRELRARQDGDEMFILLVTGKTDRADLEMALEVGANDYLTKPIDLSLLNVRLGVAERQIRDVTERKRAEDDRLTKSKIESLGTLAGGIAHDLNNILTVISGNIGLAQLEAPVEEKNLLGCLAKASQAAQEAAHMSSQLLTFSKGGSPVKKVVRMSELLSKSAHFSLHGSNLRAEMDIPPDLWPTEVDPTQIEQVINALMINAREAMPSGGTVDISARNVELDDKPGALLPDGRYIKVAIADHGSGVPADMATKIFDPYFTTKPVSSGLGLSISFSIVKKHGGMLHLEQSCPAGAVFAFFLPAATAELAVVRDVF